MLETVGFLFLVTRSNVNVSQSRRITSKCNKFFYGIWRMILQEFNMEQLICIVQKSAIKLSSIFESDLKTARSKGSFSDYQETTAEFIESLKSASSTDNRGPFDVDLDKPAKK